MVLGKRRSPRNRNKTSVSTDSSPPRKKRKIERTPTVEVIHEENEDSKVVIERKTTSFLEELGEDENISTLSSNSRSKLLSRLSSILNESEVPKEPDEVDLCRKEGFMEYPIFSEPDDPYSLYALPIECIRIIFSYLSDFDRRHFGLTCIKIHFILNSFVGFSFLPVYDNITVPPYIIRSKEDKYRLSIIDRDLQKIVLNTRKVTNYVRTHKEIPKELLSFKQFSFWHRRDSYCWKYKWHGELVPSGSSCQPKGLSLCLYDYQAKGLAWMLSIERMIKNKTKFVYSTLINIPSTVDIVADTVECDSPLMYANKKMYKDEKYKNSFTTKGGMFCDEMGLGKTISLISLILSNPRDKNRKDEYDIIGESKYQTHATLVVCPSHLVSQWVKEIETHSTLTCKTIATAAQHKKVTYQDIIETDVIVVSGNFIEKNPRYKNLCDQYHENEELPELDFPSPILHIFGWHRIIVDEAHEIVEHKQGRYRSKFSEIDFYANYRWYVTGTPVKNGWTSMNSIIRFLHIKTDKREASLLADTLLHRAIKRSLFWRNTKDSLEDQITIPSMFEEIELVTLSSIERTIYDSLCFEENSEVARRRFISDPNRYTGNLPLDDSRVPLKFLNDYKLLINRYKRDLKYYQKEIKDNQNSLKNDRTLSTHDKARIRKHIARTENFFIPKTEKLIVQSICQAACIAKYLGFDDSTNVCEGCDEFASGRVKLLCNHLICYKCIQKLMELDTAICIKCDNEVDLTKLKFVDDEYTTGDRTINNEYEEPWFTKCRATYGSKFAYTTRYLKNIMNSSDEIKMIVFSQFEPSLLKLSSVLQKIDPDTFENRIVMCKGNLHARKRQLERFTEKGPDSARILLLSLKNSASGTHLASATHILLLDQVAGTEGEARATDAQAIARAHRIGQTEQVTAIRFIAIKTIDQEDYERAYGAISLPNPLGPKSARK